MRARVKDDKAFELITKCRQSGLSDNRWCIENNIPASTFYTWISRLKLKGYKMPEANICLSQLKSNNKQEVVKINPVYEKQIPYELEQNTTSYDINHLPVMEISCVKHIIKFYNGVDSDLVKTTLHSIGGDFL